MFSYKKKKKKKQKAKESEFVFIPFSAVELCRHRSQYWTSETIFSDPEFQYLNLANWVYTEERRILINSV